MKVKKISIKRIVVLVLAIIVIIISILFFKNLASDSRALRKIGYEKQEITVILDKLSDNYLAIILDMEYQEKLVDILNEKYYLSKNFEKYLAFLQDNQDKSTNDIIAIVNVGAYKPWYEDTKLTDLNKGYSMLVNKFNRLSDDYDPGDLVNISNQYAYENHIMKEEAYSSYVRMWRAANDEDLVLIVNSSYRTFQQQKNEHDRAGDGYAARPGHSEHQTGLALDIVTYDIIGNAFEETDEFRWLINNAHKYGFILRYPKGKEYLTGYNYESWHYRYLGVDLASKVFESGLTFDEYYAFYLDN